MPIATAEEILSYMGEVIEENDLARHIRYQHRLASASWSSEAKRWTIEGTRADTGAPFCFTAGFLWMCQGYYDHDRPTRRNGTGWTRSRARSCMR